VGGARLLQFQRAGRCVLGGRVKETYCAERERGRRPNLSSVFQHDPGGLTGAARDPAAGGNSGVLH
jgi:hypothetical protein